MQLWLGESNISKGVKDPSREEKVLGRAETGTSQYFLQSSQSNQSNEAQRRDANQSSQSISTPVTEEDNTSTEMPVNELTKPASSKQTNVP